MDMSKYAETKNTDLKAADYKGKKFKAVINQVDVRTYEAKGGQAADEKGVLFFEGINDAEGKPRGLVLYKTNTKILINAYGSDSESWLGQEIGLSTHETELGG